LDFFIKDFIPKDIALHYFPEHKKEPPDGKKESHVIENLLNIPKMLLNAFLCKRRRGDVLISSDLNKIPKLFENLKNKNIIFLREKVPAKLLFHLFKKGVRLSLYSDFKISKDKKGYLKEISYDFIDKIDKLSENISVKGYDLSTYVKIYMTAVWKKELIQTLKIINQTHAIFNKHKITALLVDEDRGVHKNLLVQVSKQYCCKSYVNCHGDLGHKIGFLPLTADYIFSWGELHKELFINWGLPQDKIIITGCSKYDICFKKSVEDLKRELCNHSGVSWQKPVCVIAPMPLKYRRNILEATMWQQIKDMIITVSKFKDMNIIVKLHSGDDNLKQVELLVKNLNHKSIKILKEYDPLKLAKLTDILIVHASTFALDGFAYKKPVILTSAKSFEKYKHLEFFYDGTTLEKLDDSLNCILTGRCRKHLTNWQKTADYVLDSMDGKASIKIAEILAGNLI
jgi:hypothetical protein